MKMSKKNLLFFSLIIFGYVECVQSKMHVLFVLNTFPWYTNITMVNLAIGLLNRGHEVPIYADNNRNGIWPYPEAYKKIFLQKTYNHIIPQNLKQYDIILFENALLGKKFIYLKKRYNLKAKMVTCFQGLDITGDNRIDNAFRNLLNEGHLFLPSCEYLKYKLQTLGFTSEKVIVHSSGVDCERFKFRLNVIDPDKKIQVITVGKLGHERGIRYAISAFATIARLYPNIQQRIIGDKQLEERLKKFIKKSSVGNKVHFVGLLRQRVMVKE